MNLKKLPSPCNYSTMTNYDLPLTILLSLVNTFCNGFGYYLQKKGLSEINTEGFSFIKFLLAAIKNKKWSLGFFCIIIRIPLYAYALNIGYLTVTQPIANTFIIIILFLSRKYLHEKLGKIEIIGTCLIFVGICIIAFSPSINVENPSNIQLIQRMVILGLILACIYGGCFVLIALKKKIISLALISGISIGVAVILIRAASITLENDTGGNFLDFQLDARLMLGIFSNDLLLESVLIWGAAICFILYFLIAIPAVRGAKLTFVTPVLIGTSVILPIFAGFLIFMEPALPLLIIGICSCIAGVLMLSCIQAALDEQLKEKPTLSPHPVIQPSPDDADENNVDSR